MNLKERNRVSILGFWAVFMAVVLAINFLNIEPAFATKKKTTRPKVTVHSGNWNPFVHDYGKVTVYFCERHPCIYVTPEKVIHQFSKVTVTLRVKSSYKKTKEKSVTMNAVTVENWAPSYCVCNDGSFSFKLKSPDKDKHKVYAKYETGDCFCLECFISDDEYPDAEYYSNRTCKWKKEK